MGGYSNPSPKASSRPAYTLTGTIVVTTFFFFLLLLSIFFVYFYARRYRGVRSTTRQWRRQRNVAHTHFVFTASNAAIPNKGIEPSILFSLPVTVYRRTEFKEAIECAVCLTELADGEKARLLPKCNHGFHLECINMWFHSHSTCPICRRPVVGGDGRCLSEEPPGLQPESSDVEGERMLYVSIPVRSIDMLQSPSSPLTSRGLTVDEKKSPIEDDRSPVISKVGSFTRILTRGKRIGDSACPTSPTVQDIEQGMVRSGAANGEGSSDFLKAMKTPTNFEEVSPWQCRDDS